LIGRLLNEVESRTKRRPIKPIANYDASIILVMYFKKVYLLVALYAEVLHSLAGISFLLGLTAISHLEGVQ